ncbi:MAG TPA: pinensin family lanthipeptide [Longimicrobium sp.]|nr:pinensin family lanthipeptide [Longimicrobium sp.]
MNKPELNLDQLTVDSFTTSDSTPESEAVGIVDTGCVSDCATGCGFGGTIC